MRRGAAALAALALACAAQSAAPLPYAKRAEVQAFIRDMVERHGFVERELEFLFSRARRQEAVLKAIVPSADPRARSSLDENLHRALGEPQQLDDVTDGADREDREHRGVQQPHRGVDRERGA